MVIQQALLKIDRNTGRLILVTATIISMVALLIIQVKWLRDSIIMQEAIFTKGVNMALKQTVVQMANDEELSNAMQSSMDKDSIINSQEVFTQNIISRLDSTIQKELEMYHINLDFHFLLINGEDTISVNPSAKIRNEQLFHQSFQSPFPDTSIDLAILFPGKSNFVIKGIGVMFATSILLIVFNMTSIFLLLAYYRRERLFARQVKDMIGNLTHEFMTPISSISLAGNMIYTRNKKTGDEQTGNFAMVIKEENKKLQRQVDRLLQLAEVEKEAFEYKFVPVDIHKLINESVHSMSFRLNQCGAAITTTFDAVNSIVSADEIHMANVFINLLSNSIKYTVAKPEIKISTQNIPGKIEITFADNGIGIPAREYNKIFEKYYRISTGDTHNTKGFGIGLYYAKTVIDAHFGTISVKSDEQNGSVFTIILPVKEQ